MTNKQRAELHRLCELVGCPEAFMENSSEGEAAEVVITRLLAEADRAKLKPVVSSHDDDPFAFEP
jgi:hypothetical protein